MQYSLYQLKDIFNKHAGDLNKIAEITGYHIKTLRIKRNLLARKFDDFYYCAELMEEKEERFIFANNDTRLDHLDNPEKFTLRERNQDFQSINDIYDIYNVQI